MAPPNPDRSPELWGLEPCNVLLRCVKTDQCQHCDPNFKPSCFLKMGSIYRATARSACGKFWYLPGLSKIHSLVVNGVPGWCLELFCTPHFGEFDEGQESLEVKRKIMECIHIRVPETEDA